MRQPALLTLLTALAAPSIALSLEENTADDAAETPATLGQYGAKFVEFLRTDLDARNEHGLLAVEAFLEGGDVAGAETLAAQLDGYRRALAFARIGLALASSGDERGARFLEQTRTESRLLIEWQKATAQAEEAVLTAALGQLGAGRRLLDSLFEDPVCYEAQARMFRYGDAAYRARYLEEFLKSDKCGPLLRGWALLETGRGQIAGGDLESARGTLARAAEELAKRGELRTAQLLGTVSVLLLETGDREGAARWAAVIAGFAERFPQENGWRARGFAIAARAQLAAGDLEGARTSAHEAAKIAAAAESIALPEALIAAADAATAVGETPVAERMIQLLCNAAARHPHHRAKAMAALQVIGWRARRGLGVDETTRRGLEALARAIENDPFAKS